MKTMTWLAAPLAVAVAGFGQDVFGSPRTATTAGHVTLTEHAERDAGDYRRGGARTRHDADPGAAVPASWGRHLYDRPNTSGSKRAGTASWPRKTCSPREPPGRPCWERKRPRPSSASWSPTA